MKPHAFERGHGLGLCLGTRTPEQADRPQGEVSEHIEVIEEVKPLKDHAHPLALAGDVAPGISDPASIEACKNDLYDNSIAFTDLLLGQAIAMVKPLHRPSFLVYLSDHGETPSSPHWRDASSPDLLAVPLIVWFSPEYRARYPETVAAVSSLADEPRELDRLLPMFRVLVHLDRPEGLAAR